MQNNIQNIKNQKPNDEEEQKNNENQPRIGPKLYPNNQNSKKKKQIKNQFNFVNDALNKAETEKLNLIQKQQQQSVKTSIEEQKLNEQKTELEKNRQTIYEKNYAADYDKLIQDEQHDISFCLQKHNIKELLRAKMVDWMIEVFGNFLNISTNETYFRAISIMDLYMKKCSKKLKDSDVHLIGVASMFIASKLEDIYHINLNDILARVAHNKFTKQQFYINFNVQFLLHDRPVIKQQEWDILTTLNFDISFANQYTYLLRFQQKLFGNDDESAIAQNIKETSIYIMKLSLHEYKFLKFSQIILAISVIKLSFESYFDNFIEDRTQLDPSIKEFKNIFNQKLLKLQQSYQNELIDDCCQQLKEFSSSFEIKYPELQNLKRFNQ